MRKLPFRSRTVFKSKGTSGSSYDPQVGAAAQANAALAERAQNFSEQYYTNTVAPMLEQMRQESQQTQARMDDMYALNKEQMQLGVDRYKKFGIPAEDRYYDMVAKYSADDEQENQARLAMGDVRTAAAGQARGMRQQWSALGIDPSSPAASAAMSDMAIANTAAEAGAANRARTAAKSLGMQLTADAANFGRGGQSSVLNFGSAASGNATGSFGVASGALGSANASASVPMAGYSTAMQGYGANLQAYSGLANTEMTNKANASSSLMSGIGSMVGTGVGLWAGLSDERAKTNIRKLYELPSGIGVYAYTYKGDTTPQIGVLAQEVQKILPSAVVQFPDGLLRVDYTQLR